MCLVPIQNASYIMSNNITLEELERRIQKLEEYREQDTDKLAQNHEQLAIIIKELKMITASMQTITDNWKEAIMRSNASNDKKFDNMNTKIDKIEQSINDLSKVVDERTILKESKNYNELKSKVLWAILAAIISFIMGIILV